MILVASTYNICTIKEKINTKNYVINSFNFITTKKTSW